MVVKIEFMVFWVVTLHSVVVWYHCFRISCFLYLQPPHYTAQQPRKSWILVCPLLICPILLYIKYSQNIDIVNNSRCINHTPLYWISCCCIDTKFRLILNIVYFLVCLVMLCQLCGVYNTKWMAEWLCACVLGVGKNVGGRRQMLHNLKCYPTICMWEWQKMLKIL
jgi:hypothetical protein